MNDNEKTESIKAHWEAMSSSFGADLKSTTKNLSIKKLEIDALSSAIRYVVGQNINVKSIMEMGCGNGFNTCALSKIFPNINFTGVDYIPNMIVNAKTLAEKEGCKNIEYKVGDILDIESIGLQAAYDIVFTDRCIINLDSYEKQKRGIQNLVGKTSPGGYLIILENNTLTYGNQNLCRKLIGLEERIPAQYNLFLDESLIMEYLDEMALELIDTHDFGSLHDLFLYVILPKINGGKLEYDSEIIKAITDFCINTADLTKNKFGDFGQNRLYLLRKESSV